MNHKQSPPAQSGVHNTPIVTPRMTRRIESLDLLRGIAVLGILLVNIVGMGTPYATVDNPTAYGPFTIANQIAWAGVYVFAQQKFIAIFAMLFGAGILLLDELNQRKGLAPKPMHFKRMGWLALFGLLHAWFLWYGDILLTYAVAGCLAWLWRQRSVLCLASWGLLFYAIPAYFILATHATIHEFDAQTIAAIASNWSPSHAEIAQEIAAVSGGLSALWHERGDFILTLQTSALFFGSLWLALGYMLFGMALFKLGVLSAKASRRSYRLMTLLAVPGLALTAYAAYFRYTDGFSVENSMFLPMVWLHIGSLLTTLGYIAIFILCLRGGALRWLTIRLQAVGRIAFSLYIMHSVMAVILFNWLGLFGQLQRFELILLAIAVGVLQLWLAPIYLARFSHGPLEYVWRKLTYGWDKTHIRGN